MLFVLSIIQAILLSLGQLSLKVAMSHMPKMEMSWAAVCGVLTNWWLMASGALLAAAGVMWMYILKHYPFSQAYPLSAMAFVFGMIASVLLLGETVSPKAWIGVLLIMAGCWLIK